MSAEKSGPTPQQGRSQDIPSPATESTGGLTGEQQLAEQWLTWLYGEQPHGMIWIGGQADRWVGRVFATPSEAAAYAMELDTTCAGGVYHRLTTLPDGWSTSVNKRGSAVDSAYAYALSADLDIRGVNHKSELLPDTADDYVRLLKEAGLPEPSAWVHSGGGLYPYWKFPEPVDLTQPGSMESVASMSRKLHEHIISWGKSHGWRIDNTSDLARVYRLPGTTNRKDVPTIVRVEGVCL